MSSGENIFLLAPSTSSGASSNANVGIRPRDEKLRAEVTVYLPSKPFEGEGPNPSFDVGDLLNALAKILDSPLQANKPVCREGALAFDIIFTADNMWGRLNALQEQVYTPHSDLNRTSLPLKPFRVSIRLPVLGYCTAFDLQKEKSFLELAYKAAKNRYLYLVEEEIRMKKLAEDSFVVAEKAHQNLRQAFDMYTEVALNVEKTDRMPQARSASCTYLKI